LPNKTKRNSLVKRGTAARRDKFIASAVEILKAMDTDKIDIVIPDGCEEPDRFYYIGKGLRAYIRKRYGTRDAIRAGRLAFDVLLWSEFIEVCGGGMFDELPGDEHLADYNCTREDFIAVWRAAYGDCPLPGEPLPWELED